ncbi:MAG: glycosyltransferase [Calditrichaceae bacterium]
MSRPKVIISIIIVNYNVRDFLEQALISVKRALEDIASEIIVVDNASIDGSTQMLRNRFPEVRLIENDKNLGFSAANNLALTDARGEYIVLLNPDTVVQEDTFKKLIQFFEQNPAASAATCKILNPDGTFSIDCRHSIPTPMTAFWKLIGFNRLFPKSKIFGRYNLTYLDENNIHHVEAISGSFMMIKKEVVQNVGLLDDRFFMYCEDIDYCHRINQSGGKIYYVPTSQLIHYKGESTKKNDLDYVVTFNKSLYFFYKKHYQQKYIYPFKWLILLGVILRGLMIFIRNFFTTFYPFLLDLLIMNGTLFLSFYLRYEMKGDFSLHDFFSDYIIINLITSASYFFSSLFFDSIDRDRYSLLKVFKANLLTYTFVSALTFFFKQFAFSRLVVLFTAFAGTSLMLIWRIGLRYYGRKYSEVLRKDLFAKRALIVGLDDETQNLLLKLNKRVDSSIEIVGLISPDQKDIGKKIAGFPVLSSIQQLPEFLRLNKINLVIFSTHNISYKSILTAMANVENSHIEFKMVPGHLEFMVGKSNIERLDNMPLVDIEYAYGKLFNRFVKRSTDIFSSFIILTALLPVTLLLLPFKIGKISRKPVHQGRNNIKTILWYPKKGFFRFILNLINVFSGKLSLVGAPLEKDENRDQQFDYKPGLTGIIQINKSKITDDQISDNFELHYLKNQNFLLDAEIIYRTLFLKK